MAEVENIPNKRKKGQVLQPTERQIILNVYNHEEKRRKGDKKADIVAAVAEITGIGVASVYRILRGNKEEPVEFPKKRKRISIFNKLDDIDKEAIRRKVHKIYLDGELPTLDKILQLVNEDSDINCIPVSRSTLYGVLQKLQFKYCKRSRNNFMMEREEIVIWRRRYLRDMRKYRNEGRQIFYLDETWLNAGDTIAKTWVDGSVSSARDAFHKGLTTGAKNPTGKGQRLIITHIGSEQGFVEGGLLCFQSKTNSDDYHNDMNHECFLEWFKSILILLPQDSIVVMDNASYHSKLLERIPNTSWKKADIIEWLRAKNVEVDTSMVKAELLALVKQNQPMVKQYVIDHVAEEFKVKVLRLPPYHCELNPIELVWAQVKTYVKKRNTTFKIKDVEDLLHQGIDSVTADDWAACVRHTLDVEKKFGELDHIIDQVTDQAIIVNPMIINSSGSDTESVESTEEG